MVDVLFDEDFKKIFSKIKDVSLKNKLRSQIKKIAKNPLIGKPMKYSRKNTREVYVKPFRLSYFYEGNLIIFLDLYHNDNQ